MPTNTSLPSPRAHTQVEKLRAALEAVGPISFATVREYLDFVTRSHTAFPSFSNLIHAAGNYFPSIQAYPEYLHGVDIISCADGRTISPKKYIAELDFLALAYDMAQEVRGDNRRAYRS